MRVVAEVCDQRPFAGLVNREGRNRARLGGFGVWGGEAVGHSWVVQTTDQGDLDYWLDTARIIRVFDSYFRALDDKHFDESHFRQIFSSDAKVVRPNGAVMAGPMNIVASHSESFTRFEASQHLLTGHDVAIDGDAAVVRANLVAIHLWKDLPADASMLERSFTAGGVVTAELRRVPDGWRISEVKSRILWRTGHFGNIAQTR